MKSCILILIGVFFALTALPLQASQIVEVGVFQVELLGPGESAVGGNEYQFGNPSRPPSPGQRHGARSRKRP
jgi:hypothetical protein